MALTDYLSKDAICMRMASQKRDEAIRALLEQLVGCGMLPAELVEAALAAILKRELLGSTAIGKGVAVPHARLEELGRIVVAFGHCPAGVGFSALDGAPVHEIFLVIAPTGSPEAYLEVMQRITRLVQNEDFRRFVSQIEDSDGVVELVAEMDA